MPYVGQTITDVFPTSVSLDTVTATTSLKTPLVEFTDGDNAFTISDGGNVAFSGTVSGVGMNLLSSATISSTIAEYDVSSSIITSAYDNYKVIADFMMDGEGRNLYIRAISGGSQITSSAYARENAAISSSTYDGSNSTTIWAIANITSFGNATGEGISIDVNFYNMTTTTKPASLCGRSNSFSTSALHNSNIFGGAMLPSQVSTVLNGIRFSADSGNISSGRVKVYGIN